MFTCDSTPGMLQWSFTKQEEGSQEITKMAKTSRQQYKRELDRSINNLDWSIKHLIEVRDAYAELHPDIAEVCNTIGLSIEEIKKLINKLNEQI